MYKDIAKYRDQIRGDAEIRKLYRQWLDNPMTQIVIDILTVEGQPHLAQAVDGYVAAQALGHAAGWADAINRLQLLAETPPEEPDATFEGEPERTTP